MSLPFKKRPLAEQYLMLLSSIEMTLREPPKMKKKWKTTFWGVAKQYAKGYGNVKVEDFDLIKDVPVGKVVETILEYHKKLAE